MDILKFAEKYPGRVRFKTIKELSDEFGENWKNCIKYLGACEVMETIPILGGKTFYPSLIKKKGISIHMPEGIFLYLGSAYSIFVSTQMLTTHRLPLFDIQGEILKPGMLVVTAGGPFIQTVSSVEVFVELRNKVNTVTRILKIVQPAEYLMDGWGFMKEQINEFCVATELVDSRTGLTGKYLKNQYGCFFVDEKVCSFEYKYRLRKATAEERKEYYKKRGADLD